MQRTAVLATVIALALSSTVLLGCSEARDTEARHAENRDALAPRVAADWKNATGEEVDPQRMTLTKGELSESHAVMASMILMGNGMESDLSKYKEEISLMEFLDSGGTRRAAVIVGNKVVIPKAADAAPVTPTGELSP